jgi:hypothetical protein
MNSRQRKKYHKRVALESQIELGFREEELVTVKRELGKTRRERDEAIANRHQWDLELEILDPRSVITLIDRVAVTTPISSTIYVHWIRRLLERLPVVDLRLGVKIPKSEERLAVSRYFTKDELDISYGFDRLVTDLVISATMEMILEKKDEHRYN